MQQGNLAIRSSAGGEASWESKRCAGEGGKKKTRETGKQEACGSRKKGAARETVKKWGAIRGLPRRSPILVLLSSKHV